LPVNGWKRVVLMKDNPDFLDRVYYARKDGTVLAFDESEALIRFDDGKEQWIRFEKIRLVKRAKDWAYDEHGNLTPWANKTIRGENIGIQTILEGNAVEGFDEEEKQSGGAS
jgi:hypothetical protein